MPKTILVGDMIHMLEKESGFYIIFNSSHSERHYVDADDFYENPESVEIMEKELKFIATRDNQLAVYIDW